MDKQGFLAQLNESLEQLPELERSRFLDYYAEMIDDRVEEGVTEAAAIAALGTPQAIAREIMLEQPLGTLMKTRVNKKEHSGGAKALLVVLMVLGSPVWLPLSLAVLVVVLAVYLVIWVLVAAVFIVDAAIGLSGLALVLAVVFLPGNALTVLAFLGIGLALIGLGVLLFFPAKAAAQGLIKLTGMLARGIKSLFIRRARG